MRKRIPSYTNDTHEHQSMSNAMTTTLLLIILPSQSQSQSQSQSPLWSTLIPSNSIISSSSSSSSCKCNYPHRLSRKLRLKVKLEAAPPQAQLQPPGWGSGSGSGSGSSSSSISTSSSTSNSNSKLSPFPVLLSLALSVFLSLSSTSPLPSLAIPSLNSPTLPAPTTPFSLSKDQPLGLLQDGKIRPCPSTNPGCISTNPKSSSFAFPWRIPEISTGGRDADAVQKLKEAILKTQKNPKVEVNEDTPFGRYLRAEVDGGFGRDVLEFLVRGDVVAYRTMATKVTYVYPFTTAFGDSKGQEERMKKIMDELGWNAPSFDSMD